MDGGHARGGHDFGTVGDQVEEDGHGGLGRMVEATAEHRRQVAGEQRLGLTDLLLLYFASYLKLNHASHPRVMQASLTT